LKDKTNAKWLKPIEKEIKVTEPEKHKWKKLPGLSVKPKKNQFIWEVCQYLSMLDFAIKILLAGEVQCYTKGDKYTRSTISTTEIPSDQCWQDFHYTRSKVN
jgi:hypothetical protein